MAILGTQDADAFWPSGDAEVGLGLLRPRLSLSAVVAWPAWDILPSRPGATLTINNTLVALNPTNAYMSRDVGLNTRREGAGEQGWAPLDTRLQTRAYGHSRAVDGPRSGLQYWHRLLGTSLHI